MSMMGDPSRFAPAPPMVTLDRLLKLEQVIEMTGLSCSTIYKWQSEGRFPRAVLLGSRAARWVQSEISAWVHEQRTEGKRASIRPKPDAPDLSTPPGMPQAQRRGRGRPRKA
ncbi:helix-turn-helix transcriptional regulator [Roseomonas populi]|uniref:AlpA family phage regulatory protein n=1 Tax=Roseomonas populi TaxID=3121582 RepID=A0ABT1X3R7_9PROT|nr:AlpA family phage regulatory protein [Roseomonas pecuniae]MCR0981827.1 AlpA family phage regulatory protein [Roseomonas pecuniae]